MFRFNPTKAAEGRPSRVRATAACVAAALATTITLLAAPASAAAPNGFDNTDPSSTGCSTSAITYWSKNLVNPSTGAVTGVIELRYSRSCQTNWVRINNYVQGATARKIIVRQKTYLSGGGSIPYDSDTTEDTVYGYSYGMQLYAPPEVCVQVGGVLTLNGQVVGNNGQTLDQVC